MSRPADRRDARTAWRGLTPVEQETLGLLVRLPLLAAAPARHLVGLAGPSSLYRCLARLGAAGLVASLRGGTRPGPPPRLFFPTDLGHAAAACAPGEAPAATGRARAADRPLVADLPALPRLVALHELLGALAVSVPGRPELLAWERPWRPPARYRVRGGVVLLARAALAWGERTAEFLLLADPGTVPLAAYRSTLRGLLRLRAATGSSPTLVVATHDGLPEAWDGLLRDVAVAAREAPIAALVVRSARLDRELRGRPWPPAGPAGTLRRDAAVPGLTPDRTRNRRPRTDGGALDRRRRWPDPGVSLGARALGLGHVDRAVIDLVGRHAFLALGDLAEVLDWTERHARSRCRWLVARGLLRLVGADELSDELRWYAALGLPELTTAGLRLAAAQLGLTRGAARRFVGLTGGGPLAPFGPREYLLGRLEHTRGVEWVCVRFVVACRRAGGADGDPALVEWRNTSACANGRVLPDGYGALRRDGVVHGFFVEYDRGTMSARDLRAKIAGYRDYRDDGAFARAYHGFPTILVVAASGEAEARFARAVRETPFGPNGPPPVLLATRGRIAADPGGPLGAVWSAPRGGGLRRWPPADRAERARLAQDAGRFAPRAMEPRRSMPVGPSTHRLMRDRFSKEEAR